MRKAEHWWWMGLGLMFVGIIANIPAGQASFAAIPKAVLDQAGWTQIVLVIGAAMTMTGLVVDITAWLLRVRTKRNRSNAAS